MLDLLHGRSIFCNMAFGLEPSVLSCLQGTTSFPGRCPAILMLPRTSKHLDNGLLNESNFAA